MRAPSSFPFPPIPHCWKSSTAAGSIDSPPRSWIVTTASSAPVFSLSSTASAWIESADARSMIPAKSLRCPRGAGHSRAWAGPAAPATASAAARRRSAATRLARAVVRELEIKPEVLTLDPLDDRLEIVPVLARHPHLCFLDLGLDPDSGRLDELHDLLRLLRRDAFADRDHLADGPLRRGLELPVLQRLQGNAALRELAREDVDD